MALISAIENTGKSRKEFLKETKFILFLIHVKNNINTKHIINFDASQDQISDASLLFSREEFMTEGEGTILEGQCSEQLKYTGQTKTILPMTDH